MKKIIQLSLLFAYFYLLLSCQSQSIILTGTLPDQDKLPKRFNEHIIKWKSIYFKNSDSIRLLIKDKPESYTFNLFENEKEITTALGDVEYWVLFNYKIGIPELIKRITNTKEVGLVGSVNLIIDGRVESGDMPLETGDVIFDDLFRVSGRANYLLKVITGEDFGSAGMYASEIELIKLQRKWIRWYSQICEKN